MDSQSFDHLLSKPGTHNHILAVETASIRYGFQVQLVSVHSVKIVISLVVGADDFVELSGSTEMSFAFFVE